MTFPRNPVRGFSLKGEVGAEVFVLLRRPRLNIHDHYQDHNDHVDVYDFYDVSDVRNIHYGSDDHDACIFSVTRRSRSDESHLLTY